MGSGKPAGQGRSKSEVARIWIGLFSLFTALGVLEFSYRYLDDLARARSNT